MDHHHCRWLVREWISNLSWTWVLPLQVAIETLLGILFLGSYGHQAAWHLPPDLWCSSPLAGPSWLHTLPLMLLLAILPDFPAISLLPCG